MTTSGPRSEPARTEPVALVARLTRPDSRPRRLLVAAAAYVVATVVFATFAGPARLTEHTPYNHYALLADAWLHGRQDLAHGPPPYAQNNDFAEYAGKTFISFPPFPALLMLPFVKLAGSPENFRDGQFVVWLAGVAPAALFLVLEKLRRTGRSARTETQNVVLALLFAFGTVYFFTAVEGTVWFAAQVVGAALFAFYLLFALDAERPLLAGVMVACAYLTRPPILLASVFFALEALRVARRSGEHQGAEGDDAGLVARTVRMAREVDPRAFATRCGLFAAPIVAAFAVMAWMNFARYGRATPFPFDHQFLTVTWQGRMLKWGLFNYHFLAKNLGIALTSLPWLPPGGPNSQLFGAPFKINEHGLALWFTTPLYLWVLWPRRLEGDPERRWLYAPLAASALIPAALELLYQNSGWRQFGYRFSNDYARSEEHTSELQSRPHL